jgi:hypothetical protein
VFLLTLGEWNGNDYYVMFAPLEHRSWETGLFSRRGTTAIELRDPETARKVCGHFGLEVEEPRPKATG